MSNRTLIIYNPVAGNGKSECFVREVLQALNQRGLKAEIFVSSSPGEARSHVRQIEPDVTRLLVAGGDGTINEVINGLSDPSKIPLAILPIGTSNVVAHELALPDKPDAIVQALERGRISWLDMGLLGKRRFLLYVSVGLDAMISEEVLLTKRNLSGYWRYIIPVAKALKRYYPTQLNVAIDGHNGYAGEYVIVSNTRNYGGGLTLADRARYDSGHLDVCVFPRSTFRALSNYYYAAIRGRLSEEKDVLYLTGRQIEIESKDPVAVQVDGDYVGTTPVVVDIIPSSAPVIVPNGESVIAS